MTKYAIAVPASLFATNAIADDVYHGLPQDNADLLDAHRSAERVLGVQPGVGDRRDIYAGLADSNPDLFSRLEATGDSGSRPDIYQGLGGSSNLSY